MGRENWKGVVGMSKEMELIQKTGQLGRVRKLKCVLNAGGGKSGWVDFLSACMADAKRVNLLSTFSTQLRLIAFFHLVFSSLFISRPTTWHCAVSDTERASRQLRVHTNVADVCAQWHLTLFLSSNMASTSHFSRSVPKLNVFVPPLKFSSNELESGSTRFSGLIQTV
jgi:hypothetical protein